MYAYAGYSHAALSCSIGTSPPSGSETTVLKLYASSNTHAALPGFTAAQYYLKCRETTEIPLTASCSGNYVTFLRLTSSSNAHVQQPSVNTYTTPACISSGSNTISCAYAASCAGYDTCLASISGASNAHIGQCGQFPVNICCSISDSTPPAVGMTHAPADIGSLTAVTYTATATDASGIKNIWIFVDSDPVSKKVCSSSPCTYTEGPYAAGTSHTYYAVAEDMTGNIGTSPAGSFTVCKLDSASISGSGNVKSGDKITINAAYHGACPSTAYMQVDARDGTCRIEATAADMTGIQGTCSSSPCTAQWTVPAVPLKCQGATMSATAAALYKSSYPPSGERFDGIPATGSFRFYFDSSNTLSAGLGLSRSLANRADMITGFLACYVSDAAGNKVVCDNANTNVTFITISGKDYIAQEGWSQALYYNSTYSFWEIPINTLKYQSTVSTGVLFIPGGLSATPGGAYTVNLPPEISDAAVVPSTVSIGDIVNFSARITDPDPALSKGVDRAKICGAVTSLGCVSELCTMSNISDTFRCSYDTSSLPPSVFGFYVFANDTLGAWNFSLIPGNFSVVPGEINISVIFPGVVNKIVPTTSPEPNFTRSMDVDFIVTAQLRNLTSGVTRECTPDICSASYNIDGSTEIGGPGWTALGWDPFDAAWRAAPSTVDLVCDMYHDLNVKAESLETPGLTSVATYKFFVNCIPKVTVTPIERRLTLGAGEASAFNVTVWNPLEAATFTLEMKSQMADGMPLPWVSLVCGEACTPSLTNDDKVQIAVGKISSNSVQVSMPVAPRSGVYPITFAASVGTTQEYKTTGTIQIFSEGLGEFAAWQLAALLLAAVAVWFWIKPGKRKPKQGNARKTRRRKR